MTTLDLSYPVGRFRNETNITSERRQALIDGIAQLPVEMRAAVNNCQTSNSTPLTGQGAGLCGR